MFDNKTVFVMLRDGHEDFIYKLEVDADTQQAINQIIDASAEELVGKQLIMLLAILPMQIQIVILIGNNLQQEM